MTESKMEAKAFAELGVVAPRADRREMDTAHGVEGFLLNLTMWLAFGGSRQRGGSAVRTVASRKEDSRFPSHSQLGLCGSGLPSPVGVRPPGFITCLQFLQSMFLMVIFSLFCEPGLKMVPFLEFC